MKTYLFIDDIEPFKTVRDFRELYDDLVSKEIESSNEPDGRLFRKGYVEVNNGLSITHIGVSTEDKIIECLNTLITYLEDDEHPELYRYMVAHYFYEYVHPFYDGNGRTGRLLVCSYLSRYLERYSAITFSYAVNKNKNKYYKALEGVPNPLNKGELTFYLMDMLELLSMGQEEIIEDLEISLGKRERIAKFFNEDFVESSRDKWLILKFMVDISVFVNNDANISITKLMDAVNITRYKVDKIVSELESEGYIEQVSLRPKAFKVDEGFLENTLRV
nr:Fic family protein [Bacillus altitudinis]